jgi:acetolactate synthase-1/2/3 large subunit
MALADAKLSGRAGVVLANRAPGATNASIAVHSAKEDATPLVLLVGHVKSAQIGRRAFQEMDYAQSFSDLAKAVLVLHDPRQAGEVMARALRLAEAGTPGPVVLAIPEDVLLAPVADPPPTPGRFVPAALEPGPAGLAELEQLLAGARRPLIVAGSRCGGPEGRALLRAAAERHGLPVAVTSKRQDLFANEHPLYAGHLQIATRPPQRELLAQADLVLALGTRLDHVTTKDYTLLRAPVPVQPLVHVHPDPERLGFVYEPALSFACEPEAVLRALCDRVAVARSAERDAWAARLHALERAEADWQPVSAPDGVVFGAVVRALGELLPADAIVSVDAGNFAIWVHRYLRCSGTSRLLAGAASAMGFGVPAAVAAGLSLVVVIADNASYGTIRQHQERAYPERVIATELVNPDFVAAAQAYGALGLRCASEAEIEPCLRAALAHRGVAVVDVRTSLAWIHPNQELPGLLRHLPSREQERALSG